MSYVPLHHKYRPQTFAELVGQEAIATTLTNAIVNNKIAPAYLFTGARGTGKTSSARILAKSLNCLSSDRPTANPCGECEVCLAIARSVAMDVIEIDAASNTGVDNIREIIDRAQFAPVQCRYKVYAIDECHMLSTAAFNALLKTLEEPPAKVVFVLATTDPQRVLPTIISRCQRFDYRRIPIEAMVSHIKRIASIEEIEITDEAITLVGQIANGGLRDAQSLLDQLSLLSGMITLEKVWDLVGAVPERDLLTLIGAIKNENIELVLEKCRHLLDRGREPLVILQNLASFYLNLLIAKTSPKRQDLVALTEPTWHELCTESARWSIETILQGQQQLKDSETQIKNTTQPRLWLEITLLGLLSSIKATQTLSTHQVNNSPLKAIEQKTTVASVDRHSKTIESTVNLDRPSSEAKSAHVAPSMPKNVPLIETTPTIAQSESIARKSASVETHAKVLSDRIDAAESNLKGQQRSTNGGDRELDGQQQPVKPDLISVENKTVEPIPTQEPEFDRQEIWDKVIASAHPPITKVLLRQHCHLIDFKSHAATIGISSPQLLKLNQNKIPNIEAAFAKVCDRKVKVTLEVVGGDSNASKQSDSATKTSNSNKNFRQETVDRKQLDKSIEPKSSSISSQEKADSSSYLTTSAAEVDRFPQKPLNSNKEGKLVNQSPTSASILVDEVSNEQNPDASSDEIDKAIETLVKSFEGEAIDMSDRADKYLKIHPQQKLEVNSNLHSEVAIDAETPKNFDSSHLSAIPFKPKQEQTPSNPNLDDDVPF
ncbi:MAG: DNA polymerase III subunit gamma/tau [Xenococcaceae cyanobacterium]